MTDKPKFKVLVESNRVNPNGKPYLDRINGILVPHQDGEGHTLFLNYPVAVTKFIIRENKDDENNQEQTSELIDALIETPVES